MKIFFVSVETGYKFFLFFFLICGNGVQYPAPHPSKGLRGIGTPATLLMAKRTTKVLPISLSDSDWVEASQWLASHGEPASWCFRTNNGDSNRGRWHIITLSPDKGVTCFDFFLRQQEDISEAELIDFIIKKSVQLKASRVPGMAGTAKIAKPRSGMVYLSRKQLESIK